VVVRYVDRATRVESIRSFPELDPAHIVEPHYVTDGFSLPIIPDCSQDFVIANHVLEHTPNPLAAIVAWHRVLRPGGVIFAGVPMVDKTFDRGRPVTPPPHILEDWRVMQSSSQVTERDMPHYREWVTISLRAISLQNGTPLPDWNTAEVEQVARTRMEESDEIHFHTFSRASYGELLKDVVPSLLPGLRLVELHECSGYEAVAVLVKS
jgi:SAM-dependent methyltransferase